MFRNPRIQLSYLNQSLLLAATTGLGYEHELRCKCSQEKEKNSSNNKEGTNNNEEKTFFGYFPLKQLHQPKKPYPAWDDNWDGKEKESGKKKGGVTRHMILIRHGQYDETHKEDSKRHLTQLGRDQAHLTGKRLAEMIKGIDDKYEPCNVKVIRVSDMTRAKETASIISEYLPKSVIRAKPDPLLNEGIPAQIIPKRPELDIKSDLALNGPRIEKAFVKYFHRSAKSNEKQGWFQSLFQNEKEAATTKEDGGDDDEEEKEQHEFDIIVCHGNVIRYFFCRALQLPPEAWLRMSIFNCSLTYLMIMPNGRVSCRMLGDIGHLGYGHSTFSMHHGFVW